MKLTDTEIIEALENNEKIKRKIWEHVSVEHSTIGIGGRLIMKENGNILNFCARFDLEDLKSDDWEIIED